MVIAVVDDLLFSSKIRATARAAGTDVTFARERDAAVSAASDERTGLVIIDLDGRSPDAIETIRAIRSASSHRPRIVGYGSHVNVDRLTAAREAGCDQALARSAFVGLLPALLAAAESAGGRAAAVRPTLADVEAAALRLRGRAWHTPLVRSAWLSELTGAEVLLKLESVQTTGAFKFRGAFNALARLREQQPETRTVVTASAGNHGLAMATAAARLGMKVRVHIPSTAPRAKREALLALGAELIEAPTYDDAEIGVREEVERTGAVFVSAYSDTNVIAGAGTAALEMLEDRPDLDAFIVPVGGGGLLSGTAIVARARASGALLIGAEAEASPVFTAALAAGKPVTVPVAPTIADGLAGNMEPDSQTFGIVRDLVDRVVRVREDLILAAMRGLARNERLIVEGAGAAGVAALLAGDLPLGGRRVGVILSGRNVDVDQPGVFF